MDKKSLLILLIAVFLSFMGGFLWANSMNRGETEKLRAENELLKSEGGASESPLSVEEIDAKMAEADRDPENAQFQKNLGMALYRYASTKQDTGLLEKSIRLLERAAILGPNDRQLLVDLGNANFDFGYVAKKNDNLANARAAYQRALDQEPNDVEVRTDLGLTYFLQQPPVLDAAVKEFQRSLKMDSRHEKTLQFMIQALVKQNKPDEAQEYLERLKTASPSEPSISQLSSMINQARQGEK